MAGLNGFAKLALAEQAFRMYIISPVTGLRMTALDGQDAYVDVYSTRSKAAEGFKREAHDARNRIQRRKAGATYDEDQARGVEMLVAITAGWFLVDFDGNAIPDPFTKENARTIYSSEALGWLAEQVLIAATDDANFIKSSAKASSITQTPSSPAPSGAAPAAQV